MRAYCMEVEEELGHGREEEQETMASEGGRDGGSGD